MWYRVRKFNHGRMFKVMLAVNACAMYTRFNNQISIQQTRWSVRAAGFWGKQVLLRQLIPWYNFREDCDVAADSLDDLVLQRRRLCASAMSGSLAQLTLVHEIRFRRYSIRRQESVFVRKSFFLSWNHSLSRNYSLSLKANCYHNWLNSISNSF